MSRAGFHFDKTQHVFVPANEIDLAVVARSTKVPRDDNVAFGAEVKVRIFFSAATCQEMSGSSVRRQALVHKPIEAAKKRLRNAVREHEKESSRRMSRKL